MLVLQRLLGGVDTSESNRVKIALVSFKAWTLVKLEQIDAAIAFSKSFESSTPPLPLYDTFDLSM